MVKTTSAGVADGLRSRSQIPPTEEVPLDVTHAEMGERLDRVEHTLKTLEGHVIGEMETVKADVQSCLANNTAQEERLAKLEDVMRALLATVEEMREDLALCKKAIASGAGTTGGHPRVEAPKPKAFAGQRDAKEVENFLWQIEQYSEGSGTTQTEGNVGDEAKEPRRIGAAQVQGADDEGLDVQVRYLSAIRLMEEPLNGPNSAGGRGSKGDSSGKNPSHPKRLRRQRRGKGPSMPTKTSNNHNPLSKDKFFNFGEAKGQSPEGRAADRGSNAATDFSGARRRGRRRNRRGRMSRPATFDKTLPGEVPKRSSREKIRRLIKALERSGTC